ncbi:translation factor SUA5 [Alteribacillus persepolensis]|uniref:Threonylcarbamoyl-AMP synthase n=1 Tax=Alteribacillus persepolensis TaxID=568899 RepID=A0A1G8HCT3_9BACI|nr:L-threonylcarbamoyladenylate synthase [Alteribacillus persepolensis]SDI04466.1 translation factor SUA5 [Alteribacillus persepolensis]
MSYKQTKVWNVDNLNDGYTSDPDIKEAALWIKQGEAVAFPTETVYGLGADATSDSAVEKIFKAKGRPGDNPLIVHIGSKKQLTDFVAFIPRMAEVLIKEFWPGPLTLIFPKRANVSEKVTAGLGTVAVRMPDHVVARALLKEAELPVAAPSANQSGRPSPTKAQHVYHDLHGRIAGIVDGGPSGFGLESTVVDCTGDIAWILRPGGVTKEQLESVLGEGSVRIESKKQKSHHAPKAPGMKYRHYAPDSPLVLVEDTKSLQQNLQEAKETGRKTVVMAVNEHQAMLEQDTDAFICLGSMNKLEQIAAHLYDNLRQADQWDADIIFCETFPKEGIGEAIMNRLEKASFQS